MTISTRNRNEEEIAGYRDVLKAIHELHDVIPVSPNTILQLHRDLCKHMSQNGIGGHWKHSENVISETDEQGRSRVRFQPMSAFELIPLFILDFLCIHPFSDGNGRMSRLLTLLLMYQAGYVVGKYISMEMVIERSKETYYEALRASSQGWLAGENDPVPFVRYFLGMVLNSYRTFEERVEDVLHTSVSKPKRIRNVIDRTLGKFKKAVVARHTRSGCEVNAVDAAIAAGDAIVL